jgi:hypothetical protein
VTQVVRTCAEGDPGIFKCRLPDLQPEPRPGLYRITASLDGDEVGSYEFEVVKAMGLSAAPSSAMRVTRKIVLRGGAVPPSALAVVC